MDKLKEIMYPLFDMYEDYYDIKEALRSMHSNDDISEEEYDKCLEHWDDLLSQWERSK